MTISETVGILGSMCKMAEQGYSQKVKSANIKDKEKVANTLFPQSTPLLHRDLRTSSPLPLLQIPSHRLVLSQIPLWEICQYAISNNWLSLKPRVKWHPKNLKVQTEPTYLALEMPLHLLLTQHRPLRKLLPRLTLRYRLKQPSPLHSPNEV